MKIKTHLFIIILLSLINTAFAQTGNLDLTFNIGTGFNGNVELVSVQNDDKIIVAGLFNSFNGSIRNGIARLNSDGSLDASFDPGTGFDLAGAQAVAFQSDGKIIIGGGFNNFNGTPRTNIARLNTNGSIDLSFNTQGTGFNGGINSIAMQGDGKIIVGGYFIAYNGISRNYIARLNADGSLDPTFNPGSGFDDQVRSLALQPDGKIIAAGHFTSLNGTTANRIARLNADGTIDVNFNPGTGFDDYVLSVVIQTDGKIVVGGDFSTFNGTDRNKIVSLNSDGTINTGFNPGDGPNGWVKSLAVQSDGKIIAGGSFSYISGVVLRNKIVRINADGTIDGTFNQGMGFSGYVISIDLQTDGKIIAGGYFTSFNGTTKNHVARLLPSFTTGIHQSSIDKDLVAFPNPSNGIFNIEIPIATKEKQTIKIYNVLGEIVYTYYSNLQINKSSNQYINVDFSDKPKGIYFIKLEEQKVKKLFIQ